MNIFDKIDYHLREAYLEREAIYAPLYTAETLLTEAGDTLITEDGKTIKADRESRS